MGNSLEKPETNKDTSDVRMGDIWAGISGMQGYRGEMEDAHIHEILDGDHLFLGVFDGHGGKDCAHYVCAVRNPDTGALAFEGRRGLVQVFKETPEWKQYLQGGKKREDFNLLKIALERAFMDIDHEMEDYLNADRNRNTPFGGCTACTVLITPHHIICANAGDSRATMSYVGSKYIELSQDHKPHNKDELERIKNAGGYVQHNRIDGNLAVSRGLGDFEFKLDKSRPPKD